MIYNNSPPGELQKEPRKTPRLFHTGGRKHQQLQTDDIQEHENGCPTITREQLQSLFIIMGTRSETSILSPERTPGVLSSARTDPAAVSGPSHRGREGSGFYR